MITLQHGSTSSSARCSRPSRCSASLDRSNTQALRQCRLLGADGAQPARRRPARRFRQRPARARPGRARRLRPARPRRSRRRPARRSASAWAERLGNRLFLPALIIPATALVGTLVYQSTRRCGQPRPDRGQARDLSSSSASACCSRSPSLYAWLRPPALAPLQEGRRLIDAIGWAAVLPQMLAALGVVLRRGRRRRP